MNGHVGALVDELAALTRIAGLSGYEEAVARRIVAELRRVGLTPRRDAIGNVIVWDRPGAAAALVTAHMDQVGYMVSRVSQTHAWCLPVGDVAPEGAPAVVVVAADGSTWRGQLEVAEGREAVKLICPALDAMRPGDPVLYDAPLRASAERIRGAGLDDRVGCWILLSAAPELMATCPGIALAWTVQEEVTGAGALLVARALNPGWLVSVDVTYAQSGDTTRESDILLGRGPAITLLDGAMVAPRPLVSAFASAADNVEIAWQREVVLGGESEAGKVQNTLGIPSLPLLVPIESPHSPGETAHVNDIVEARQLLVAGLSQMLR